jgi:hypothetical protein
MERDLDAIGRYIADVPIVEFVREEEAVEPRAGAPELSDGKAQASLIESNIVTFPESTPVNVRNAVANWMLLAQLAASKAVKDRDAAREWMSAYIDTLTKSGWVLREEAGNETEEALFGSTVHQKILVLLTVALGPAPAALALVTAALQSLQEMNKNSPWITLFDRRGRFARSVGFQVANCETDDSGAALRGTEFVVEAHQTLTQVLFFKFTSHNAKLHCRSRTLTLSAEIIDTQSAKVADRILDQISSNILNFDL